MGAAGWTDTSGTAWLFGGYGYSASVFGDGLLNDVWKFSNGQWTWVGGASTENQAGTYGIQGTAAANNMPGARYGAHTWVDYGNTLWLFGGYGVDAHGDAGLLNDLWKYAGGQWTWMGGSNTINAAASYGTQGVAAISNNPGARMFSVTWTDSSGNLWLFGGQDDASSTPSVKYNDLWKYSGNQWTWMGGSKTANSSGTFGTQGVANPGNVPSARSRAIVWRDTSGGLWLFGGYGVDSTGEQGHLNDLWRYSNGQWTWVGGNNTYNWNGTYGTQGVAAATNLPGSRSAAVGWVDAAGGFWLFGGFGFDGHSIMSGTLNDIWRYYNGQWTWIGGENNTGSNGTYGTQGTASTANIPSARGYATAWGMSATGTALIFGGTESIINLELSTVHDLWRYKQ